MHTLLKTATIAIGLAGATLAGVCTANARDYERNDPNVGVAVSFGNIAFGYRDGYWDHDRQWHRWQDRREARRFRDSHRSAYHHWDHGRDRNQGWYDRDDRRDRDARRDRDDRHDQDDWRR